MKAFRFGLEQALRWREQNVRLEEARLAAAGARVAAIRAEQAACDQRGVVAARDVIELDASGVFHCYEAFRRASRKQALVLLDREKTAGSEYAARMASLVEASRKARLLEKLRESAVRKWQSEADREVSDFAAEAFLMRHSALRRAEVRQSLSTSNSAPANGTIKERTGA